MQSIKRSSDILSSSRIRKRLRVTTAGLLAVSAVGVVGACSPATPAARTPITRGFGAAIEATVPCQAAAKKCVASDAFDKPGPVALRTLLTTTYGLSVGGRTVAADRFRPGERVCGVGHRGVDPAEAVGMFWTGGDIGCGEWCVEATDSGQTDCK